MDRDLPEENKKQQSRRRWLWVSLAVVMITAAVWVLRNSLSNSIQKNDIRVATAEMGDVENTLSSSGEILPDFEAVITSPITAVIQQTYLDAGASVKAGDKILELTAEILAAEKYAYGKVIRLMAHEVNNSIGAVNSILDSTLSYLEHSPDVQSAVQIAVQRNEHLNHFMRNFADIVRLPLPHKEQLELNELVRNIAQLMEFNARQREIGFSFELDSQPVWVWADRQQMEQVLVNVVKNALESIGKNGQVTFKTTNLPAQLEIRDNGPGIAPEIADQLFSPFFSTKRNGQGVGLTLVREIMANHDFGVSLQTEKTGETVCRLQF